MRADRFGKTALLTGIILLLFSSRAHGQTVEGTKMPKQGSWVAGFQADYIFRKEMKRPRGTVRSEQYFVPLRVGITDWFSLDGRLGAGNITFDGQNTEDEHYNTGFAGGYGFRLRLLDEAEYPLQVLAGFQHISTHGERMILANGQRRKTTLDEWQWSLVFSKTLGMFSPYIAPKYCKLTLNRHTIYPERRKLAGGVNRMGLALGLDMDLPCRSFLNIEARFFDEEALTAGCMIRF